MSDRLLRASARWARLLLRLYPADFREEMGAGVIETYMDHCRDAVRRGGVLALSRVWLRALVDSVWNGIAEHVRPGVSWRRSGDWGLDAQRAVRRLVRAPMFAAAMVGTLTVGLGAFATVYAVVDRILLAPLPYERPDDLYFVWRNYTWVPFERGWVGGTDVVALQAAGGAIEGAVGLRTERMTMTHGAGGEPAEVPVMLSTPNLFSVLGVRLARGRGFAPNEGGPGRPPVIVLSDNLWRDRFGAEPSVIGSEVRLDGRPFTVIGVTRPDFHFQRHASDGPPESAADAYITFEMDLATTSPNSGAFAMLVRARDGTSPEVFASAVGAVGAMIDRRDFRSRGLKLYPVGAKSDLVARVRPALVVLGSAGGFLVLVLAVNLATLLLARVAQREREFAISRALGANHVAIARATVLEGGLLGLLGGIGGTVVAVWGARALVAIAPADLPRREAIGVDWRIAATVVTVGTVLGLVAALLPAMWATRTRLVSLLANTNVRGGGGHGRMRRGMVVVQVALSLVLLTTGGLVVRSFDRLLRANPGFDARGVLTMRVPVSSTRYEKPSQANPLHDRLEREIGALPGVTAVGAVSALPLTSGVDQAGVSLPGAPGNTGDKEHDEPLADYIPARGRYFDALGIRLVAGRLFGLGIPPGLSEVLIDRTLAEQFYPAGSPVGARIVVDGDTGTVIGVIEHARQFDIHENGRPQVYVRNETGGFRSLSFAIKTDRAPEDLIAEVRAAVHRVDPELAIADLRPMQAVVDASLKQQRLSAVLITGFSLGALSLAAMGLFGVVAGSVNRRRHEIAVRLALGADYKQVRRLVLREGAGLVLGGVLLGVPGIYLAGRAVAGALVGVSPFDGLTLTVVAGGLVLVALVACYIPARRVTGIEPAQAFREE